MSGGGGDTEQDSSEGDDEIWNDGSDETIGASSSSAVDHRQNGQAPPAATAADKPKFAKSTRGLTARARAQQQQPVHPEGEAMGLPEEGEEDDSTQDELSGFDAAADEQRQQAGLARLAWLRLATSPALLTVVILAIAAVWAALGAARAAAADGDSLVTPTGGCAVGATDVWTVTGASLALYVPLGLAALWATGELTDVFSIRFEFMWSGAGLLLALAVHVAIAYAYSGYGDGGGGAQGYGTAAHALVGGGYVYLVLSLWVPVALSFSASFAATNRAIEQRALAEGARAGGEQRSVFHSARIKAMAAGEGDDGMLPLPMPGGKRSSEGAGAPRRISAYEAVSAALDTYQRIRRSFHLSHITQTVGPDQLLALCRELAEQARAGKLLRTGGDGAGPTPEKGSVEVDGPSELGASMVMHSGSRRSHTTNGSTGSSFEVGAGMAGSRVEQAGSGSFVGHTILAEAEASSMLAGLAGAMTGRRGVLQLAQARCPASLEASTLADLLSHRPLYTRFRDYLKSEFSTENLLFFEQATVLEIGLVERLVQRGLVWGPGDTEPRARTEAYFVAVTGEEGKEKEKGGSTQIAGGAAAAATEGKGGSGKGNGARPLRRSLTSGELKAVELLPADQAVEGEEDGVGDGDGGKDKDELQREFDESMAEAKARRHSVNDKLLGSQGGLGSRSSRLEVEELDESQEAGDTKGGSKTKGLVDRMDTDEEALQALRKASRADARGSPAGLADGGARQGAMSLRHMKGIPADLRLMLGGITHVAQRGVRAMFSSLLRSMKQAAARGWLAPEGQDLEQAKREVAEYLTGGTRAVTERFVKPGSPLEVNISSSQRRAVLRAMKKGSPGPGVLVPAKREIRRLMQMDSLPRFRAQAQQGIFFKKYQRKFQAMVGKLENDAEERKRKKQRQEGSKAGS